MPETHTPLWISARKLEALLKTAPTPLFVYDEKSLVRAVQALFAAFSWEPGFLPRFPVRMDPDPPVLRILRGALGGFYHLVRHHGHLPGYIIFRGNGLAGP